MSKQQKYKPIASVNNVTLSQYLKLFKLEDPTLNDQLVILCRINPKDLRTLSTSEIEECARSMYWYFDELEKVSQEHVAIMQHKGTTYGFIPDLNETSYGEYLDMGNFLKDPATYENAIKVMYRKVTKRIGNQYNIEEYTLDTIKNTNFSELPYYIALSAINFLTALAKDLLKAIQGYISRGISLKDNSMLAQLVSSENIVPYINSLKEMLEDLKKFQVYQFTSAYTTSLS